MSLHDDMIAIGDRALAASRELVLLSSRKKNSILEAMADALDADKPTIVEANQKDMKAGQNAGLSSSMLDRLLLNDVRIEGMIKGQGQGASLV